MRRGHPTPKPRVRRGYSAARGFWKQVAVHERQDDLIAEEGHRSATPSEHARVRPDECDDDRDQLNRLQRDPKRIARDAHRLQERQEQGHFRFTRSQKPRVPPEEGCIVKEERDGKHAQRESVRQQREDRGEVRKLQVVHPRHEADRRLLHPAAHDEAAGPNDDGDARDGHEPLGRNGLHRGRLEEPREQRHGVKPPVRRDRARRGA
jgi:hypothetical protein